jgi:gas vesicle protein
MKDRDEVPYIVVERGNGQIGSFVLGALVGAGLALLFAPKTGAETQEDIKAQARRLKSAAEVRVREAQKQLEERLETAREGVQARVEGVKDAVDASRKAASEARDDIELRLERSKAAYRAGVDAARRAAAAVEAPGVDEAQT